MDAYDLITRNVKGVVTETELRALAGDPNLGEPTSATNPQVFSTSGTS